MGSKNSKEKELNEDLERIRKERIARERAERDRAGANKANKMSLAGQDSVVVEMPSKVSEDLKGKTKEWADSMKTAPSQQKTDELAKEYAAEATRSAAIMAQKDHVIKEQTYEELQEELHGLQKSSMNIISEMVKVNVDTLETLNRQIEQTEGDLRKLGKAQEDLDEAQHLVNDIKRGIFAFGSGSRGKPFQLPKKQSSDVDFPCKLKYPGGGDSCILRLSTMMYQANHKGDEAATSIPYQKVEGCVVQKEGVIVIHFRPKFHAQIGTKQKPIGEWEVKLKDPMQTQAFVRELNKKCVEKGSPDDDDDGDDQPYKFILGFADGYPEFKLSDVPSDVAKSGKLFEMMRKFQRMEKKSVEAGNKGELSSDDINDLQSMGLDIVIDQLGDVGDSLDTHMKLLVDQEEQMTNLIRQAQKLTKENQELLDANDGCCTCTIC